MLRIKVNIINWKKRTKKSKVSNPNADSFLKEPQKRQNFYNIKSKEIQRERNEVRSKT